MAFALHGCEHIGKRVTRRFEGVNVGGVVSAWAAADGQEEALYRVRHDDGDEEDLDRQELEDALALAANTQGPIPRRANLILRSRCPG